MKTINILKLSILSLMLAATSQAETTLNIVYGFTPNVKNANGGSSNTRAKISDRHTKTKNGHNNCGSGITFARKTTYQTSYNSNQGASTQLARLASGSQLTDLRATADSKKADLVQFYCEFLETNLSGRAQLPGPYSVIKASQLSYWNNYSKTTSAHEIGHNLNANHDTGFCLSNNKRTIMADNRDCDSNYWNLFSSSWKWFDGVKLGNSSHNTREVMIRQAPTSANFR